MLVSQNLTTVEICNRFGDKNHMASLLFHNQTCWIQFKAAGDASSLWEYGIPLGTFLEALKAQQLFGKFV